MLTIRAEQMAILGTSVRKNFELEMADHLSQFFPEQCAKQSEEGLSKFVATNIDRALGYGLERERDVCKFLDVAMALGEDFDRSGDYPWAKEILEDEWGTGEEKIDRLVKLALKHEQGGELIS